MDEIKTPMLDRIQEVREHSEELADFINWITTKYYLISKTESFENNFIPLGYSSHINIEGILAEYFDIDLRIAEEEKQAILNAYKNR